MPPRWGHDPVQRVVVVERLQADGVRTGIAAGDSNFAKGFNGGFCGERLRDNWWWFRRGLRQLDQLVKGDLLLQEGLAVVVFGAGRRRRRRRLVRVDVDVLEVGVAGILASEQHCPVEDGPEAGPEVGEGVLECGFVRLGRGTGFRGFLFDGSSRGGG